MLYLPPILLISDTDSRLARFAGGFRNDRAQFDSGDTFKLIYTVAEVVGGDILAIGNPNCRVRVKRPIHEFMEVWCLQGPSHHVALGLGDLSREIQTFADAMNFKQVRV